MGSQLELLPWTRAPLMLKKELWGRYFIVCFCFKVIKRYALRFTKQDSKFQTPLLLDTNYPEENDCFIPPPTPATILLLKCAPQASSMPITREMVRNARSQPHPRAPWIRIHNFTIALSNSYTQHSWRNTALLQGNISIIPDHISLFTYQQLFIEHLPHMC